MFSYEPPIDNLLERIGALIEVRQGQLIRPRVIITISGIPGSGKTSLAQLLVDALNSQGLKHHTAVYIPMDGFHLPRSALDQEGLRRRGAPHTFDVQALLEFIQQLKMSTYRNLPTPSGAITAPGFDHAVKDPVADQHVIARSTNVIIVEGNYLLLNDEPWNQIQSLATESWFLECPFEIAKDRLARRHVAAGITETLEAGLDRVEFNDEPNGRYLIEHSNAPALTVKQTP